MARCAILRSGLVEEYGLSFDQAGQGMAPLTAHVTVHPLQRELSAGVMVEERRLPLRAVVAVGAGGHAILCELLAVDIFVALLALGRRGLEIHIDQGGFQIGRLVAVHAGGGAMGPDQWEGSPGMVEVGEFLPGLGGVASLAPGGFAVGAGLPHALIELSLVRVGVASRAGKIVPVIEDRRLGLEVRIFLVAIATRDGDMPSS